MWQMLLRPWWSFLKKFFINWGILLGPLLLMILCLWCELLHCLLRRTLDLLLKRRSLSANSVIKLFLLIYDLRLLLWLFLLCFLRKSCLRKSLLRRLLLFLSFYLLLLLFIHICWFIHLRIYVNLYIFILLVFFFF